MEGHGRPSSSSPPELSPPTPSRKAYTAPSSEALPVESGSVFNNWQEAKRIIFEHAGRKWEVPVFSGNFVPGMPHRCVPVWEGTWVPGMPRPAMEDQAGPSSPEPSESEPEPSEHASEKAASQASGSEAGGSKRDSPPATPPLLSPVPLDFGGFF